LTLHVDFSRDRGIVTRDSRRSCPRGDRAILNRQRETGAGMASKRKGGIAPYVAVLVAVIIFVPSVREVFADLVGPLVDLVKDAIGR
jgi:hypothetical protein